MILNKFVDVAKNIILMSMKKIAVSWIKEADATDLVNLNQFLSFSAPKFLEAIYLHGDHMKMNNLLPWLPSLLKKVRKQIYIFTMELNETALAWIFENLENVSELIIRDWTFTNEGDFPSIKNVSIFMSVI